MKRGVLLVMAALAWAPAATALDKQACAEAFERSQELRADSKLRASREQLIRCADASCPAFVQRECAKLLPEVEASLPTVLLDVRRGDAEARGVAVYLDGAAIELSSSAVPLDPGEHELRVEAPDDPRLDPLRFRLREGEKRRVISVQLRPAPSAPPPASSAPVAPVRPRPTAAYALAGFGALSLLSFGYLAKSGADRYHDLEASCAPRCPGDQTDPLRRRFLAADVSLGLGVAALAAAAYLLLRPTASPQAARAPALGFSF